ncbi:ABC transporter permease [Anaerocolumna sp.]|uniref:ABC transporter permease n=1 Tax=Anaerocolumna sp. TaxID=2041569 RepID=UPI0028A6F18F|nr:FtsX-like permease family protein [Anaerocolumna sp.]
MLKKIIFRELKRGKVVSIILSLFIAISAMLSASAADLLYSLAGSMNNFFEISQTSHLLQMHSGGIDEEQIDEFVQENDYIKDYQIVTLLNVEGDALVLDQNGNSELGSVIDNSFVIQNTNFDYLLDEENKVAKVSKGEAAVPVYYEIKYGLKEGDTVSIKTSNGTIDFVISAFVRDSEMNSSYISSKRILLCKEDWNNLKAQIGSIEYMVEFRVFDTEKINVLEAAYLEAGLPSNGPIITYSEIRLLNSLTDIMMAALIILVAIFLIIISILCVRFTMIACIDEEYMDIAAMKGIGIPAKFIADIYLRKYLIISMVGCIIGYYASFHIRGIVQENLDSYMGLVDKNFGNYGLQLFTSIITGLLVLFFCRKAIKRTDKVNVVEALQGRRTKNNDVVVRHPSLKGIGKQWVNVKLGIKYMVSYKKPYLIITLIFIAMTFFILLPLQLTTTVQSKEFTSYMGVAECDIRVDLQNGDTISEESDAIEEVLANDNDVELYGVYNTYSATSENKEGEDVYLNFETGDFRKFTVFCIKGRLPEEESELAISYLASTQLNKEVGDQIVITLNGEQYTFSICGIYQDITNGGKSAKSMINTDDAKVIRSVININLLDGTDVSEKIQTFGNSFSAGKITDINNYASQSMGDSISQLREITAITMLIAMLIIVFTLTVFLKLLIIRNKDDIAIMKGLGFKNIDIRIQYGVRIMLSLLVGIVIGAFLVNLVGQPLVGMVTASMGAAEIVFVTNIFHAYFLYPLSMFITAFLTVIVASKELKKIRIVEGM